MKILLLLKPSKNYDRGRNYARGRKSSVGRGTGPGCMPNISIYQVFSSPFLAVFQGFYSYNLPFLKRFSGTGSDRLNKWTPVI